jgi:hypothetical protein
LLENPVVTSTISNEATDQREPVGAAHDGDEFDQVATRLRSRVLRDALARWRAEKGDGPVPRRKAWDEFLQLATSYLVIEVDMTGSAVRVLDAQPMEDSPLMRALAAPLGSDGRGWQQCAITGRPAHHYAEVVLGSQGSQSFERLLLPFCTVGGMVDRLLLLMVMVDSEAA